MPNLHAVELASRQYICDLSRLTQIPEETVATLVDGIRLLMLHDMFEQGYSHDQDGVKGTKNVEVSIPKVATLVLMPINRSKVSEGFEGYTFKGKVHFHEKFISDSKKAYYENYDLLLDHCKAKFSEALIDKHKSLL